jgi:16S rRNA (uracil1498-N3)-methyltransferase
VNLVLLETAELDVQRGRAVVRGLRARHIASVHRAEPGRRLRVGVLGGRVGEGVVLSVRDDEVEFDVTLDRDPPAPLPCTLVLAMPRPKVLRRVLGAVAAFGVKRIALLGALRVEKSYWQSPLASDDGIGEELRRGLEQGCDTVLPVVTRHRLFRPFAEDELPGLAAGTHAIVAHPRAARPCPRAVRHAVTLVVGPEGGFVDFELGLLEAAGCTPVTLGDRPLRVEHAVAALLGRLG